MKWIKTVLVLKTIRLSNFCDMIFMFVSGIQVSSKYILTFFSKDKNKEIETKAGWQMQLRNYDDLYSMLIFVQFVNDDEYWTNLRDMIYRTFITIRRPEAIEKYSKER